MYVELITDGDCPNVAAARANLIEAFSVAGIDAHWQEWDRDDPDAPGYVRSYGSPTVLVDGRDVADGDLAQGNCCRVYRRRDGSFGGVPPVQLIAERLGSA